MATIVIDDPDALENGTRAPQGLSSASVVNEAQHTDSEDHAPTKAAPEEEEVPEKFRGKKLNDILKSYEDMEKLVGRQGAELGELRKTHDEVIRSFITSQQRGQPGNTQESTDDDTEFFVNPKEAIAKAVEKHPLVKELRQAQAASVKERALNELGQRHADWRDVVTSPEFGQFVQSNPLFIRLMQQADQNYDVVAADHVIAQFKASRQSAQVTSDDPRAAAASSAATEAARKAAVSASKVPAGAAAPAGEKGKTIYKRTDLIRKMQTDPEWYAANADEILRAYQEKRVR